MRGWLIFKPRSSECLFYQLGTLLVSERSLLKIVLVHNRSVLSRDSGALLIRASQREPAVQHRVAEQVRVHVVTACALSDAADQHDVAAVDLDLASDGAEYQPEVGRMKPLVVDSLNRELLGAQYIPGGQATYGTGR